MNGKHDVSANKVVLDFASLFQTAQIAVGNARANCERKLGDFQTACLKRDFSHAAANAARDLADAAKQLALASDTLLALELSRERDTLTITKPTQQVQIN